MEGISIFKVVPTHWGIYLLYERKESSSQNFIPASCKKCEEWARTCLSGTAGSMSIGVNQIVAWRRIIVIVVHIVAKTAIKDKKKIRIGLDLQKVRGDGDADKIG